MGLFAARMATHPKNLNDFGCLRTNESIIFNLRRARRAQKTRRLKQARTANAPRAASEVGRKPNLCGSERAIAARSASSAEQIDRLFIVAEATSSACILTRLSFTRQRTHTRRPTPVEPLHSAGKARHSSARSTPTYPTANRYTRRSQRLEIITDNWRGFNRFNQLRGGQSCSTKIQ